MAKDRHYICIDLKSFFASVECVERGLDPMTTNLVVADPTRSDKTICLAITPSMKALGIKNRCRLFQIPKSVEYIMAPPRMQKYIDYSAEIYSVYLQFFSKEDIHVYSIDEVFIDVTDYLKLYGLNPKELAVKVMKSVFDKTGITATCGIGTNLYLAKIALDITAKHVADNIGILTEESYKESLWQHKPLTDFWRIGKGISNRLAHLGIYCMEDLAKADEDVLYNEFGVNAELLIDHAWGKEPVRIIDIKNAVAKSMSYSNGQILMRDYSFEEAITVLKEMADLLCLRLVAEKKLARVISIMIGYNNMSEGYYPSKISKKLITATNSSRTITEFVSDLYDKIVYRDVPIRRLYISFEDIIDDDFRQLDFFSELEEDEKDSSVQKAMLDIKLKYGKNAVVKGISLTEEGTAMERNRLIGGHKSGEDK